jgi:hypothetical protein
MKKLVLFISLTLFAFATFAQVNGNFGNLKVSKNAYFYSDATFDGTTTFTDYIDAYGIIINGDTLYSLVDSLPGPYSLPDSVSFNQLSTSTIILGSDTMTEAPTGIPPELLTIDPTNRNIHMGTDWYTIGQKGTDNIFLSTDNAFWGPSTDFSGSDIICIGNSSLFGNWAGKKEVVAIGSHLGGNANTADKQIFIGNRIYNAASGGEGNVAIGFNIFSNRSGQSNVIIGHNTMSGSTNNSWGTNNAVVIGYEAAYSGDFEKGVVIGFNAGAGNNKPPGEGTICIGSYSGNRETNRTNKIFFDNQNRANEADGRNHAPFYHVSNLTNTSQITQIGGGGKVGFGTSAPSEQLEVYWDTNVNAGFFRGTTDTNITGTFMRDADGVLWYTWVNTSGVFQSSTTKP